jgi:hypothetical protein
LNGKDGADGKSIAIDDVAPLIAAEISKHVASIPAPKDGKDGRDGTGISNAAIKRDGSLMVTLSNGQAIDIGPVVGRDGVDGRDGSPGRDAESIDDCPDEICTSVAKALRLMAETPEINRAEVTGHQERSSPVHVHMPNVIVPDIVIPDIHVPEMKAPDVNVTVMQPPKRKTMKTVKEFDANGRIKKILEEEV